jgi:hypothetical protein
MLLTDCQARRALLRKHEFSKAKAEIAFCKQNAQLEGRGYFALTGR